MALQPRGIRNNNPGNIDYNPRNAWRGQLAHSPGIEPRFARFDTAHNGLRALGKLLLNYRKLYGSTVPNAVPQVVTWRLTGKSQTESRAFGWAENRVSTKPAAPRQRPIYLPLEKKYRPVPVYDRYSLGAGTALEAPLILEERESTLVVPSAASVTIMRDLTVSVIFGASDAH